MKRPFAVSLTALALATAFQCPLPAEAGAFSISPVRVYLTPRDRATAITLSNEGDTEVVLQADLHTWTQGADGADRLEPTEDVILAPPVIRIPPKAQQVVRMVLLRAPDASRQLTYRMIVRQVPGTEAASPAAVQIPFMLALNLPVFVTPPIARRDMVCEMTQSGVQGNPRALCSNSGQAHALLREAVLRRGDTVLARFEGAEYILPGASKSIDLRPLAAGPDGPAQLSVSFDAGEPQSFDVRLPQ